MQVFHHQDKQEKSQYWWPSSVLIHWYVVVSHILIVSSFDPEASLPIWPISVKAKPPRVWPFHVFMQLILTIIWWAREVNSTWILGISHQVMVFVLRTEEEEDEDGWETRTAPTSCKWRSKIDAPYSAPTINFSLRGFLFGGFTREQLFAALVFQLFVGHQLFVGNIRKQW